MLRRSVARRRAIGSAVAVATVIATVGVKTVGQPGSAVGSATGQRNGRCACRCNGRWHIPRCSRRVPVGGPRQQVRVAVSRGDQKKGASPSRPARGLCNGQTGGRGNRQWRLAVPTGPGRAGHNYITGPGRAGHNYITGPGRAGGGAVSAATVCEHRQGGPQVQRAGGLRRQARAVVF